jgi:hypothetical protein
LDSHPSTYYGKLVHNRADGLNVLARLLLDAIT